MLKQIAVVVVVIAVGGGGGSDGTVVISLFVWNVEICTTENASEMVKWGFFTQQHTTTTTTKRREAPMLKVAVAWFLFW